MYETYKGDVEFVMVYIREAHPVDGWQVSANRREKILVLQPDSFDARAEVCQEMCTKLELTIPAVIDTLDDTVNKAYSAWPDRLYLVGADGKVAYKGGPGPAGFKPLELELAIQKILNR